MAKWIAYPTAVTGSGAAVRPGLVPAERSGAVFPYDRLTLPPSKIRQNGYMSVMHILLDNCP